MTLRRLMPLAVVALLMTCTLLGAVAVARVEHDRAQERATATALRAAAVTELSLTTASGSLAGAAGLFEASESVEPDEFSTFSRRVLGRGDLAAVGWVERVPEGGRAAYEARTGLTLMQADGTGLRPAPARGDHYPVTYLESGTRADGLLGIDPTAEPRRRAALLRAAAAGGISLTAPQRLLGSGARGVILYQPVYRGNPTTAAGRLAALRGFIAGSYRLDDLLERVQRAIGTDLPVEIRDGDTLLSPPVPSASGGPRVRVAVQGREWSVRAAPAPRSWAVPAQILVGGGVLTLLAVTLSIVIARRDRFAVDAVARATAALRASRRSHRALVANSPDAVARYDRDLRCVFVNGAITAATGIQPGRFVGRTSAEAGLPPETAALWEECMRRVLDGEEGVEARFALPAPGGVRRLHSRLAPERDEHGEIAHVLVVTRDVTRQAQTEEALRATEDRYRALVASLSDGVVVQDATGTIVDCNPAAATILGVGVDDLIGRAPSDPRWRAVREDGSPLPGAEHPAMTTLRTGIPQDGEIIGVHRPDGALVWLSLSTRPREEAGARSVTVCFTDISARLEAGREQAALRRVATAVAADAPTDEVMSLAAREAADLIGAEAAGVVRFDDESRDGALVGIHCPVHPPPEPGTPVDLSRPTAAARVAATGLPASLGADGAAQPDSLIPGTPVSSAAAAPIRAHNRIWGAIAAATTRDDRPLPADACERLGRLGELVALAIVSSDARSRLATLAGTDDLTGLPNRRTFTERLAGEIERAQRYGRPVSLVMIDIDHFKRVNDAHGHPAGDRVLMSVAARLFASVRESEVVARIGGEEFAWILPETDGVAAARAAERMRRHIASVAFDGVGHVTVSMGVSELREGGTADDMLRAADAALYEAKDAGRDRVIRAPSAERPAIAGAPGL